MTTGQDSYQSAMLETLEIFRIDLSHYVSRLTPKYVSMLIPPRPGVYMNSSIIPFFEFHEGLGYFTEGSVHNNQARGDVFCFEDVWKHKGRIFNEIGQPVFQVIPGMKQYYSEYPIYHPAAVFIAFIYAIETARYLNSMSEPYTNVDKSLLDFRQHVRPEYLSHLSLCDGDYASYIENRRPEHFMDEDNIDLIELGGKVREFISNGRYNVYRFYLNNTTMTIEKGNDFRVIEYYRLIMSHMSEMS